jgi:hypothetical protein
MAYHMGVCQALFGITALPDVNATNDQYGGDRIAGSNIFFTNGQEDPWQWAGIRHDLGPFEEARVTDCSQCAHCVELYTPADTDAPNLLETRRRSTHHVAEWLRTA